MYGIQSSDGSRVLCEGRSSGTYVIKLWIRESYPVMKSTAYEIDSLLQWAMTTFDDYSLIVFEFTKEQEADIIMRKLKGH